MHQKALFNNYNEFEDNNLESIIRDYFVTHQQTENTFVNGLEQLNQLRVQTQAQNWSNFLIKLNEYESKQKQNERQVNSNRIENNNKYYNPLFNINHNNNTTSITIQPLNTSSSHNDTFNDTFNCNNDKKCTEYKCELNNCNKVYTTKGNLNRHLKDFHGLNSDLTPRENNIKNGNKLIPLSDRNDKSSPPPKPPMPNIQQTKVDSLPSFPSLIHLNNNNNNNNNNKIPLSLPMFNLNVKSNNNNNNNNNNKINEGYNGLEILLQAMNALDKQSKESEISKSNNKNKKERKRKYENMNGNNNNKNGNNIKEKKLIKRRKLNKSESIESIDSELDARIKKDFELGICSLCNKNRSNNLSNYNWINHLQSDHKYKCNIFKCKSMFTQKQYLNEHIEKIHK